MSNFIGKKINPRTGKQERAYFIDNYFGSHKYGVWFIGDDRIYYENSDKYKRLSKKEQKELTDHFNSLTKILCKDLSNQSEKS